jgi:transcriptional regulator with XRE-family HTH domain
MGRKSAGDYSPDGVGVLDPRHIAPRHENMRKAIGARGLTLEQFATLMNIAPSTLGRWLSGDENNAKGNRLPNEALVRAARVLGVSVWYLLDLTDSPDGSGAKPFKQYEILKEWWGKAKDPEKAAPDYEVDHCDEDGLPTFTEGGIETWRLTGVQGHRCFDRTRYDCYELRDMWGEEALSPSFDPETGDFAPESEAALDGYDAWERWFRANAAESLKRDLLALRGDYRDPLAVVCVELEYTSKAADRDKFDALLARIDAEAREAMDALA